jgi:hypothetical protein
MKTHFKKLRNPNYIGSWDLMDENGNINNKILTIKEVKKDFVFDGNGSKEECVVIHFNESKPMVMNATNLKAVSKVIGTPFIEDWVGNKLEVTSKKVKAFGEIHDALRIVIKKIESFKPELTKIQNCKNLAELKTAWEKLSNEEKSNSDFINLKDKLKNGFA